MPLKGGEPQGWKSSSKAQRNGKLLPVDSAELNNLRCWFEHFGSQNLKESSEADVCCGLKSFESPFYKKVQLEVCNF